MPARRVRESNNGVAMGGQPVRFAPETVPSNQSGGRSGSTRALLNVRRGNIKHQGVTLPASGGATFFRLVCP